MNVRFFAGTKAQYIGLAEYNPIALYFCSDTRELFWGDKLLSDGIRVVHTYDDLPATTVAADGIIYYVEESRNGYVLSSDRLHWTQIIYAPTTDITIVPENEAHNTVVSVAALRDIEKTIFEKLASVESLNKIKEISFAGVVLDKADGVFSIERDAALKALGLSFAEGPIDTDAKVVTTKAYVDNKIATLPKVDLDGYVKQEDLTELASERFVEEFVKQQILEAELNDKDADLSIFYTKSEIDELIPDTTNFVEKDELKGLASEEFVSEAIKAIEFPGTDLSGLATKEELTEAIKSIEHPVTDLTEYVKREELGSFITEIPDNYVTEEELKAKGYLTEVPEVDLSAYYTKSEVDGLIPSVPTKISELENNVGFVTASDIPSLDGYAKIEDLPTNYLVETDLEGYAKLTDIPDVSAFISEIPAEYVTEAELEEKGYLTEHQSLEGFATEEFVSEAIATIELPDAELYKVDFNAPNFAKAVEAYKAGKVLLLINAAPDVNSYALMNYVSDNYITFTKFLTNRSETYGAFNTYYLSADNTWEVSKEVKISKVEANVDGEIAGQLKTIKINKDIYSIPSTDGLASEAYVTNAINSIPAPDLSEYAKITDIPEVDGFATKGELSEAIAGIEIPKTDLTNYYTKAETDAVVELKANDVLFTTSKFVTKAIGGFAVGDDVMGLTVAQLFAKLLELSDNTVDPDEPNEPEIPEELSSTADKIIANKLIMYSVNANNELVATSDVIVTKMTPEEAKAAPTTAGFYQIISDGEVIESGYQELQIKNGDVYYVFALPKIVDYAGMVEYQSYDAEEEKWLPGELTDLYSDPETVAALCDEVGIDISHIDTSLYTVYAQEAECTGKQIRFIIKEAN